MATVKMQKGNQSADIFDSPETIAQAQRDGYHLCSKDEIKNGNGNKAKVDLSSLGKNDLLEYIGKRKLFDESYKTLQPTAIIPLFIKAVQDKVIEAKLKTAEEAAALSEKELLDLFDTLK